MRVLLLDNDVTTAEVVATALRQGGGIVDQAESGEELLELARHYDYDIVLVDLELTDMDGYDVVRRMRAGRIDTPIVMLSAIARPQAKVKAFALGADDFVTKPFDPTELVARIQAVVRRSKGFSTPSLQIGMLVLNLDSREVTVEGHAVHLTGKEYSILELLMLRKGMVLTKEALMNHLYGGMDEPEMKIIDVFVCKLRKKLVQAGGDGLIGTVWGRGYMIRDAAAIRGEGAETPIAGRQLIVCTGA